MRSESFEIGGEHVPPGEARTISIPISYLAVGLQAALELRVLHGAKPGPALFISAAIHGDEIIGAPMIQRLLAQLDPAAMAGTLVLAPAVNVYGFMQHSRYLPDRRDLNRSFPGSEGGSLAAQLAHCFLSEVIDRCSLGIDIHSAAEHRYNLPQIRIAAGNSKLVELAMVFGAPVIVESPLRSGSMRALAQDRGVDMLLLEASEALRFDDFSIQCGVSGIMRVLAHIGMIEPEAEAPHVAVPLRANKTSWVRSPRGGVALLARKSGDIVRKGDLLASVSDLFGEDAREMESPVDGIVIGHATLPVVNRGDALFHIARLDNIERAMEAMESLTDAILASEPLGVAEMLLDEDEVI
ncbi:MAG: succinylglutamate desuccinylase/aspartoacylase family protein [Sphingomonadaceae bacterium]|nr:succinylglutamate desuccinylase/aspartoacylase family protein [Sphingomonadaceae bacterium]